MWGFFLLHWHLEITRYQGGTKESSLFAGVFLNEEG